MPKSKTRRAVAARIKITKSGRVRRLHANRKAGAAFASAPHRGSTYRRRHAGTTDVSPGDAKRMKKMLGL